METFFNGETNSFPFFCGLVEIVTATSVYSGQMQACKDWMNIKMEKVETPDVIFRKDWMNIKIVKSSDT